MSKKNNNVYYVMVHPVNKGDFRPIVIDYGLTLDGAERVQRRFIEDHGLRFKFNGKHYPAHVRIYRTSETLPEGYFVKNSLLGVKV